MMRMVYIILVALCLVILAALSIQYAWSQQNITYRANTNTELLTTRFSKFTVDEENLRNDNTSLEDVEKGSCFRYSRRSKRLKPLKILHNLNCSHRFPKALIIGVKKCGTYTLKSFLDLHPQVVTVAGSQSKFNSHAALEDWLQTMPLSTPHQITVSDFPEYIDTPETLSHLKQVFIPDLKFILLLRDPTERAQSDYDHVQEILQSKAPAEYTAHYRYDHKSSRNFTVYKNYDLLPTFDKTVTDTEGRLNTSHTLIKKGIYLTYVKNLFEVVQKETVLVVDGGQFKKDPLPALKKVEIFLGLSPFFQRDHFYYNQKKKYYCAHIKTRPDQNCMGKTKGRVHEEINPNILDQLNIFYREHNLQLQNFLNQTFSWIYNHGKK